MSDMEIEFIKKRIKEQEKERISILKRFVKGEMGEQRYDEILSSVRSQLEYFEQKLKEHEEKQDRG